MAKERTHAELVDVAVAWLRRGVQYPDGTKRYTLVLADLSSYATERPDVIGFVSSAGHFGLSAVVECKVSRADFLADRSKGHMQHAAAGMGRHRWYLTPPGMVAPEETPAWCGLAYATGRSVEIVRPAPFRDIDLFASTEESIVALSVARRFQLGVRFDQKRGRFATVDEHKARRAAARSA